MISCLNTEVGTKTYKHIGEDLIACIFKLKDDYRMLLGAHKLFSEAAIKTLADNTIMPING